MPINIPNSSFHKRIRASFSVFLVYAHKKMGLPRPTPVQLDIAAYLQNGPRRIIIQSFRGVGKSHITGLFVIWCLLRNPFINIAVVSGSKDRADQFSIFVKGIINSLPGIEYLRSFEGQRDSMLSFDVGPAGVGQQFPSVKAAGITGSIVGSRADIIIGDDIETPKNSATQAQRDKISELVKEFGDILKAVEDTRIIYLGTPQTEDSLYNKLPERGYEIRVWPAEMPSEEEMAAYGDTLAPFIRHLNLRAGNPTDPARFDEAELLTKKAEGKARYTLQYMLSTKLSDADRYPLKVRDLIFHGCDPDTAPMRFGWGPNPDRVLNRLNNVAMTGDLMYSPMMVGDIWSAYQGTVMAIDPSGRGADETGYAVVKRLNGYLFVVSAGGIRGGYEKETLQQLADVAKKYKVNTILVESNFGDGMWNSLFQPILFKTHKCSLEEKRHSTQKEKRIIDTLEPVINTHKLVIDPSVVESDWDTVQKYDSEVRLQKSLIYQMTRITSERGSLRHDDRLDALAMAVAYWAELMTKDEDKGEESRKKDAMLAHVKHKLKHATTLTGGSRKPRERLSGVTRAKKRRRGL